MVSSLWLYPTFIALGLSILGAWIQAPSKETVGYVPWLPLYLIALACGFLGQFLQAPAVLALAALFASARYSVRPHLGRNSRMLMFAITVLLSLALALHLAPGFRNPLLVENIKFSTDSAPYTQYANFDKASVGLALLLFFCPRVRSRAELAQVLRKAALPALACAAGVLALSLLAGLTRVDVKIPGFTASFLVTNLLFTCVAEEAFFRGLIQTRLAAALSTARYGRVITICISAALFGLAHLGAGASYAALATVAGLGYAYVYAKTQRIEAAIMTHFLVNALHFILLTYPSALQASRS